MKIEISEKVREACPSLKLGVLIYSFHKIQLKSTLSEAFESAKVQIKLKFGNEPASSLQTIQAARQVYKLFGKDPSRYRVSSESLIRRVLLDKGLESVNPIVDCLNIASMAYGLSIGGYDCNQIDENLLFDIGCKDEFYEGVGRGALNIEGIPVLRDSQGAFGSTTTDSERAKLHGGVGRVLFHVIAFDGTYLEETMTKLMELLENYTDCQLIESFIESGLIKT